MPGLYFTDKATIPFEKVWLDTPLNVLTNGNAAVQCFFALSGFLITYKVYSGKRRKHNPINEYTKLLRVVAPGVIIAALLMATGLMFHMQAATSNSSLSFVNGYNSFTPTVKSVFSDIFYRSFFEGSSYVGPFWTIRYELLGSLLIAALAHYTYENKYSKLFYSFFGVAMLLLSSNIVSFIVGAFACDCLVAKDRSLFSRIMDYTLNKGVFRIILFVLGLYLFCINSTVTGFWVPIRYIPFIRNYPEVLRAIGIAILILVVANTHKLQNLLSLRPLKWLGRISAYTYAFHWPIILSLGCGMYLLLDGHIGYYYIVAIVSVAVFVCTFVLAGLYTKLLPWIKEAERRFAVFVKNSVKRLKSNKA